MRRHSRVFWVGVRHPRSYAVCVCVCLMKVCFLEAAISSPQLKRLPEEKGLGNNLRKRIVWPQHFGWLKMRSARLPRARRFAVWPL